MKDLSTEVELEDLVDALVELVRSLSERSGAIFTQLETINNRLESIDEWLQVISSHTK